MIKAGTTAITFLMVFLIQNTQNRRTLAHEVKLSELILALDKADNRIAAIKNAPEGCLRMRSEETKGKADADGRAA